MKHVLLVVLLAASILSFEGTAQNTSEKKGRPNLPGHLMWDIGFNQLMDRPNNMNLKFIGSRSNSFSYLYTLPIKETGFTFNAGLGVGIDKYSFQRKVTLLKAADNSTIVAPIDTILGVGSNARKSLVSMTYLELPVEFRYYTNKSDQRRGMNFALGARLGYRVDSMTKIRYNEDGEAKKLKDKQSFNLNTLRYGVYARVGFGGFNLWYYQGLSDLFDSKGPGLVPTTPYRFGVSFEIF